MVEEGGLGERIGRLCGRWMALVDCHPGPILVALGIATLLAAAYAALNLGIDAEAKALVNPKLPFQVRQRDIARTFHTLNDGILVVVDADSPFAAGRAADALAAKLAEHEITVTWETPSTARSRLRMVNSARVRSRIACSAFAAGSAGS